MVEALSVLISPIEMITALNPEQQQAVEAEESLESESVAESDDAFNEAVILNSQFVRNLSHEEPEGPHSQPVQEDEEEQEHGRLSIVELLQNQVP